MKLRQMAYPIFQQPEILPANHMKEIFHLMRFLSVQLLPELRMISVVGMFYKMTHLNPAVIPSFYNGKILSIQDSRVVHVMIWTSTSHVIMEVCCLVLTEIIVAVILLKFYLSW